MPQFNMVLLIMIINLQYSITILAHEYIHDVEQLQR